MSFPYLVLYGALTLLTVLPAGALNFYVNSSPTVGDDRRSVQSAQNPATPFRTITHALRIAHLVTEGRPHIIHVPAGYYSPDSTGETFPLVISQPRIYLSVSGVVTFDAEGRANFFRITAPTSDFVIKGITFRNGLAEQGGAIYCETCSLRVVNNLFLNNRATQSGHVLYSTGGRVKFLNNLLRDNGVAGDTGAVLSLHDVFADTTQREQIRNNTFYLNPVPNIQTSGNRTDIVNNIFSNLRQPAILDAAPDAFPLVRYNMLWETPLFYISDQGDSIKLARTVRDTVTLAESGVLVPSFMTNQPDTVAKAGSTYLFAPQLKGNTAAYIFNPLTLPAGISATEVQEQKRIRWAPTLADIGRHELRIEIQDPSGNLDFLHYNVRVYSPETFPDTTDTGPVITVTLVPDTVGAISRLNALLPTFSSAASAGNNKYLDPKFINPTISRFELDLGSPAIDAGNPTVALRDRPGDRNDLGHFGGPGNAGSPPADTTFSELNITNLPDSIAVEGQVYTYAPILPNNPRIDIIDLIDTLTVPASMRQRVFGKQPPIRWTPAIGDLGTYLVGVEVYTNSNQGRQYFFLHVKPANESPIVRSIPPTLAYEDSLFTYAIDATDSNNDPITYIVTKGPTGLSVDTAGKVSWTPTQAQVGKDTVEIGLADPKGAAAAHRFVLEVRNTNDPPLITSQPDTLAAEDASYTYNINVADPDSGETLTFRLVQGPTGMTLGGNGGIRWRPTQQQVGRHTVKVEVKDLAGIAATQSYFLRVNATDDAPVIASQPDSSAREDQLYRYVVRASDEEGGALSYALHDAPAGMRVSATGVVEWTPTQADVGRHPLTLKVSDPGGHAAAQDFAVVVAPVNDTPKITGHTPAPGTGPLVVPPLLPVQFSITATDEEGDSLAYGWWVNGATQAGASGPGLTLTPSTAKLDTVEALVWDAADTTSFSWIVDGRSIPRLSLDTSAVDFGQVAVADTGRVVRVIRNPGNSPLRLSELQISDLAFTALFASSTVAAGDSTRLELRFIPTGLEPKQGTIRFATTASSQPTVQLRVTGAGVAVRRLIWDFDNNGVVDFADFFVFADHFGETSSSPGWNPLYDLDVNSGIDFDDFFVFADHFGERAVPASKRVLPPRKAANQAP